MSKTIFSDRCSKVQLINMFWKQHRLWKCIHGATDSKQHDTISNIRSEVENLKEKNMQYYCVLNGRLIFLFVMSTDNSTWGDRSTWQLTFL